MKDIIVDIDHTLSNAFWRDGMIGNKNSGSPAEDWDAYHLAGADDKPIEEISVLLACMRNFYEANIIGVTTRPEKWRKHTMDWLVKHDIHMDDLWMRPDNDFRASPIIKVEQVIARFGGQEAARRDIIFVLDDRDDVTAAFKAIGVTVLQVHARKE